MRCRRGHERFELEAPLQATVHYLRDVVLCPEPEGERVQVITQAPALTDDLLTLHVVGAEDEAIRTVRVVESRPVIFEGQMRHELQLQDAPSIPSSAVTAPPKES